MQRNNKLYFIDFSKEYDNSSHFCSNDNQFSNGQYNIFRNEFRWGNDIIYGFKEPRAVYIKELVRGKKTSPVEEPTAERPNFWIVPENTEKATEMMPEDVVHFHQFLQKHPVQKYRELADRTVPKDETEWKKKITRSCKAKLQETAEHQGHIHFILDDPVHPWDMKAVVQKEGVIGTLVTVKELRYIYKNRDHLNQAIQFWKNGQKTRAPWKENPELWSTFSSKKTSGY